MNFHNYGIQSIFNIILPTINQHLESTIGLDLDYGLLMRKKKILSTFLEKEENVKYCVQNEWRVVHRYVTDLVNVAE